MDGKETFLVIFSSYMTSREMDFPWGGLKMVVSTMYPKGKGEQHLDGKEE